MRLIALRKTVLMMTIIAVSALGFLGYTQDCYAVPYGCEHHALEEIEWEDDVAIEGSDYDNLLIYIDVHAKVLYLLQANKIVLKQYPIATGKPTTPTPVGSFTITNKGRVKGVLGTRWMGLNVPWGSYGIHGTNQPYSIGHNASSGCIRMRNQDVEELYRIVEHNTVVIIDAGPFGPFTNGFKNLKPGDRGSEVAEVQRRLSKLGYYKGAPTGIYENGTAWALKMFLKDNEMKDTTIITHEIYKRLGFELMD